LDVTKRDLKYSNISDETIPEGTTCNGPAEKLHSLPSGQSTLNPAHAKGILMKKHHFVLITLALWLTLVYGAMILMQQINLEIFFVLVLAGFLVILHVMEMKFVQRGYQQYLLYLQIVVIIIFGIIAVHKIMEII